MDLLNAEAAKGSVEVFALVRPSPNTRPIPHAGTYLYFDVRALPALHQFFALAEAR